jgi:hypothetical protein
MCIHRHIFKVKKSIRIARSNRRLGAPVREQTAATASTCVMHSGQVRAILLHKQKGDLHDLYLYG